MAKSEKPVPELVRAAEELESELAELETLSHAARKIHLDSEKSIARAAKELSSALALPERLAAGLRALGVAMQSMERRQQAALEPLAAFALEVRDRMQKLEGHMRAFAELGKASAEATELLQSERERAFVLENTKAKLAEIAEGARALFEAARSDDFPDVAREADALKQRVIALRKRLDGASPAH